MKRDWVKIGMAIVIAIMGVIFALERSGHSEWIDDDYRDRIIQIPCLDTHHIVNIKDSFLFQRKIVWDTHHVDSIRVILRNVIDTNWIDLALPIDQGDSVNVTIDSARLGEAGMLRYAILSEGQVHSFSHRFTRYDQGEIILPGRVWSIGGAYGYTWRGSRRPTYMLHGGYKGMSLFCLSDLKGSNSLLLGIQKRF